MWSTFSTKLPSKRERWGWCDVQWRWGEWWWWKSNSKNCQPFLLHCSLLDHYRKIWFGRIWNSDNNSFMMCNSQFLSVSRLLLSLTVWMTFIMIFRLWFLNSYMKKLLLYFFYEISYVLCYHSQVCEAFLFVP